MADAVKSPAGKTTFDEHMRAHGCEKVAFCKMRPALAVIDLINCQVKACPQVLVLKARGLSAAHELRLHTVDIADADIGQGALRADTPLGVVHGVPDQNVTKFRY